MKNITIGCDKIYSIFDRLYTIKQEDNEYKNGR